MFPDLLRITPPREPIEARVTLPGSKSVTNRALTLAALAHGEVVLRGALWSEDVQVMVQALQDLGIPVAVADDPEEPGNRTLTVHGTGGAVPEGGSEAEPRTLYVGLAGTTARFLTAMLCMGRGVYRLHGTEAMHRRPQGALFQALRSLGYRLDADGDHLPVTIHGGGKKPGRCQVSIRESSQLASALLLSAPTAGWQVEISDEDSEQASYVEMTRKLLAGFPAGGGELQIEGDASGGSYFLAARHLLRDSRIEIANWPATDWQIDAAFANHVPLPARLSRKTDLGDAIMTAIVIAPLADHATHFVDLGRLRVQECERVQALHTELRKCGALIEESGDTLRVTPSELHGAEIDSYDDHRIPMCFATLGLRVPGIALRDPGCVRKTFPGFFAKLATPPPHGLGVQVHDRSGRLLTPDELIA